jgi:hypothetical protein
MDEVELIETPAYDIAKRFCHGNEEAAHHIRMVIRQAIAAEREACAKVVQKLASADAVYPAGIALLADAIRARSNS